MESKFPVFGKGIPWKWKGHIETFTSYTYPLSEARPTDKGGKEMLNMSDINDIIDLHSRGCKIGEIARKTGFDPKTIRKYLNKEDFSEEAPTMAAKASILDPYKDLIGDWLKEDQKHWNKQRHTARRVYERLRQEKGFTGSVSPQK